jgi:hypothetical protein
MVKKVKTVAEKPASKSKSSPATSTPEQVQSAANYDKLQKQLTANTTASENARASEASKPKKAIKKSSPEKASAKNAAAKNIIPKTAKEELDHKKEVIEEFIEKGKKNNILTYEEVIEFCDKNHLIEQETNDLLRVLERENVELVTQEELENSPSDVEDFDQEEGASTRSHHLKSKLESS